jgi:alpha-tubulin suppressor-like RCC1 family protein
MAPFLPSRSKIQPKDTGEDTPTTLRLAGGSNVTNGGNVALSVLVAALASSLAARASPGLPPSPIAQFWGGGRHTMALLADGNVWTWGSNAFGKLGDGQAGTSYSDTTYDSHVPLRVHGPGNVGYLASIVAISAGEGHNLALRSDGTVWAWGWNGVGQLGDGTTNDAHTPVQVGGLTNVVAISGRGYHGLALRADGTVWAWGYNRFGQIGDGTTNDAHAPIQVGGLPNVTANHPVAVSAGYAISMVLMSNGTVLVWGTGGFGELGQGQFGDHSYSPIQVMGLANVVAISADFQEPNALRSDGTMWMWGWNNLGQLGNGTTANQNLPGRVQNLANVIYAGPTGDRDNCAITSDHTVWTWGRNYNGQLGIGTADQDPHPLPVKVPPFGNGGWVVAVQTPDWHSLALRSDGTLWGWGANDHGQLGNDTTTDSYSPAPVSWPATTTAFFYTLPPCRVVDTRGAPGNLAGPELGPGEQRTFTIAGACGISGTALSLSVNLTVTAPTAPGFLTLAPGGQPLPSTSTINYSAGQTRANNAILGLAPDGSGTLVVRNSSLGAVQLIVDVNGYFE